MKLRTRKQTRVNQKSTHQKRIWRGIYGFTAALFAIATVVSIQPPANADEFDDRIATLQQDIGRYQSEADRLNSEAMTLQNALNQLANEKAAIQAQINLNQAQYEQLSQQIVDTEKKIQDNRDALGTTIANLYVNGKVTTLEMLASSKNVGDYLNQQEYRSSVRDDLTARIKEIKDLKTKLTEQQKQVEQVLNDQKAARDNLAAKENEQQNILNATKNDEAVYQGMIANSQKQIDEARATQALIRARLNSGGGYVLIQSGSSAGYTWNSSNCPMWGYLSTGGADGNGGDGMGYGCRQCASYVAWRVGQETGRHPTSWGNAVNFTANAKRSPWNGVEGGPRAGSVAVMDPATAGQSYGHVAWVETDPYVNDKGQNVIQVSQYNYDYGQGYGLYSRMELSVGAFDHYVYIP